MLRIKKGPFCKGPFRVKYCMKRCVTYGLNPSQFFKEWRSSMGEIPYFALKILEK